MSNDTWRSYDDDDMNRPDHRNDSDHEDDQSYYRPTSPPLFYQDNDDEYDQNEEEEDIASRRTDHSSSYSSSPSSASSYHSDGGYHSEDHALNENEYQEKQQGGNISNNPTGEQDLDAQQDDTDIDFDALLNHIELKLRPPFTSFEYTKTILSPPSITTTNNKSSSSSLDPIRYIRLLTKIFHRMSVSIQLRLLLSFLGLDTIELEEAFTIHAVTWNMTKSLIQDVLARFYQAVWNLLQRAQNDDMDEWVRILSGFIQGRIFYQLKNTEEDDGKEKKYNNTYLVENSKQNSDSFIIQSWGQEIDRLFETTSDSILCHIFKMATDMEQQVTAQVSEDENQQINIPTDAKSHSCGKNGSSNKNNFEQAQQLTETILLHGYSNPYFAPMYYSLLSPALVEAMIPELSLISIDSSLRKKSGKDDKEHPRKEDTQVIVEEDTSLDQYPSIVHFHVNTKAHFLTYDDLIEQSKAEEERKELERSRQEVKMVEEQMRNTTSQSTVSTSSNGIDKASSTTLTTSNRIGPALGRSVAGMNDNIKRRGIAAGSTSGTMDTASLFMRSRMSVNTTSVSNTHNVGVNVVQKQGLGRGHAAAAVGDRITPSARPNGPNSTSVHNVTGGRVLTKSTTPNSKMQIIDMNEVKDLTKEHKERDEMLTAQEKMSERKRKILEAAAAAGLKKTKWGIAKHEPSNPSQNITTGLNASKSSQQPSFETMSRKSAK